MGFAAHLLFAFLWTTIVYDPPAHRVWGAGGADGLLAGDAGQLGVQAVAVAVTMGLSGVATAVVLGAMRATVGIRVPLEDEVHGIDISEHGEEAYSGSDIGTLIGRRATVGQGVVLPAAQGRRTMM